jgi:hypothetical protein
MWDAFWGAMGPKPSRSTKVAEFIPLCGQKSAGRLTPRFPTQPPLTFAGLSAYSGRSAARAPMTVCNHARSSASALRILRRAQSETASRVPIAYSGPVTA